MTKYDWIALYDGEGGGNHPFVSANQIHAAQTLIAKVQWQASGTIAQIPTRHADEPVILDSVSVTSKLLPEFEAFRNSIREARNGPASNLLEFRAALDRFAMSDAREMVDHDLHGVMPGYHVLREEISRMIAGTNFEPFDLSTLNLSLATLLNQSLEDIRTGISTANAELARIDALVVSDAGRAELVGLLPEEYAQLDSRDAKIIEATLAIYLRRFWAEFEKLQQA